MRAGICFLAAFVGAAAFGAAAPAAAAPSEEQIKAEVAFNLLRFVSWPAAALPAGQPLVLCAVEPGSIGKLIAGFAGAPLNGTTRLAVRFLNRHLDGLGECQAVFVEAGDPYLVLRISGATHGKPILLIAEGNLALEQGAGVAVSLAGSRVVIDVDLTSLNAAGLVVSSKLLRVARTVIK